MKPHTPSIINTERIDDRLIVGNYKLVGVGIGAFIQSRFFTTYCP